MLRNSRNHLAEAGETYWEHMRFAATAGLMALGAGLACLLHAFVPALCQRTCSRTIGLLQNLFDDREALPAIAAEGSGAITFAGLLCLSTTVGALPFLAGAPGLLSVLLAAAAFAIPVAFLLSNPELASVADD